VPFRASGSVCRWRAVCGTSDFPRRPIARCAPLPSDHAAGCASATLVQIDSLTLEGS
jgi:hypothetical protein